MPFPSVPGDHIAVGDPSFCGQFDLLAVGKRKNKSTSPELLSNTPQSDPRRAEDPCLPLETPVSYGENLRYASSYTVNLAYNEILGSHSISSLNPRSHWIRVLYVLQKFALNGKSGILYRAFAFRSAYKETLDGKKYVWFIIDWYPDNWYKVKDNRHICTLDQLKEVPKDPFITEFTILH
ncbi:hypothetical protein RRG08_046156 [Elysia crispata]|uniref:Uncharacterized protein n=1 Tax=Elysia crispata TaxID=231223 RepID=A0AAE1DUK6_9GAST|nr:hypothetical protein RRG08_046156 [Elysia crispata]